eukprot:3918637-Amphidinium_carterae.1
MVLRCFYDTLCLRRKVLGDVLSPNKVLRAIARVDGRAVERGSPSFVYERTSTFSGMASMHPNLLP